MMFPCFHPGHQVWSGPPNTLETTSECIEKKSLEPPITLDELLAKDLHLVTYYPRYGGGNVGVFIAGQVEELAMMADAMSDSGDYCYHIEHMLRGTPYFPYGVGDTFQEALADALNRVNKFTRDEWFNHAYYEVFEAPLDYPKIREQYCEWEPLRSMKELIKEE